MGQSASSRPKWFWPTKEVDNEQVKCSGPVGHQKGIEGHFKNDKKRQNEEAKIKKYGLCRDRKSV